MSDSSHLNVVGGVFVLGWSVAVIFFLPLYELPEILLDQDGSVKPPYCHLVIYTHTHMEAVVCRVQRVVSSVQETYLRWVGSPGPAASYSSSSRSS